MYLNEVAYGGTAYGIEEAAKTYFGKDVKYLTLAESALLAGLPQSPSKYSPFGTTPKNATFRQKEIINLMHQNGFITTMQKNEAENEELVFAENKVPIKAPHFVFFVKDTLEEKYGKIVVEQGGLKITTTLDLRVQNLAEEVIREEVDKLKSLNVTNAASVILDAQTGEILAMVGSKDYFNDKESGNVNVATRLRQPGSSIKVVNYAYALSNGLTAATIIPDTPATFLIDGQPPYTPKNYEGEYRGNITLRSALAESRNIPAVKVLASYGVNNMIEMGSQMGITSWKSDADYGLSLTLGGGEVRLLDLATVYATLANFGRRPEISYTLKITDYQGKNLEEFKCDEVPETLQIAKASEVNPFEEGPASASSSLTDNADKSLLCPGEQVLDPRVAYIITDILKDNEARAPSFGINSLLVVKDHPEVAVKTGTSNDLRDNWTIGYNQKYVVAVWIGNNDNSEMTRVASGVTGATPIFNKIMSALLADEGSEGWVIPEGLVSLPICHYTGTLACTGCPIKMEWFLEDNKPEIACNPDWFKKEEDVEIKNKDRGVSPSPILLPNENFEDLIRGKMKKIKRKFNP